MEIFYIDGSTEKFADIHSLNVQIDRELNALRFMYELKQVILPLYTIKKIVDF